MKPTSQNTWHTSIDVPAAFVRLLGWQMSTNPRVQAVPRVSYHTVDMTGTGSVGSGAVWENPTRRLPVSNPNCKE